MNQEYVAPTLHETGFNCPYCGAFSQQVWYIAGIRTNRYTPFDSFERLEVCSCVRCGKQTIWFDEIMIYPSSVGPTPNPDLSEDLKRDFNEAKLICALSPRGAAALLRLVIEKLCKNLLQAEKGKDLNDDIKILVSQGLPGTIQKSLDAVRVIGNEAVHPGLLDLRDDVETANTLFSLVNLIAYDRITQPKKIDELYKKIPEGKLKAIEKRDGK